MSSIYLDANATSAVRPEAQAMIRSLLDRDSEVRNPSSVHRSGRAARKLVSAARENVSLLLTLNKPTQSTLFFTSGGTESCSSLIYGFLTRQPTHIVCSSIEHPAIIEPLKYLVREGYEVSWIDPKTDGIVDPKKFCAAVRRDTSLCILMTANNETGAVQPVAELAALLRGEKYSGAIVSDFTQAVWKTEISAQDLFDAGVDAVGISAHKVGAGKGVGAVLLNSNDKLCREFVPFLLGGPQEGGFRAGTENVLAIATFGEVARTLLPRISDEIQQMRMLREQLWRLIQESVSEVYRITPADRDDRVLSLSNTLMLEVSGCRGDDLVVALDLLGVAGSTGSACQSGKQSVSHVMTAMGRSGDSARNVIRLSLDWDASDSSTSEASRYFAEAVTRMRAVNPDAMNRLSASQISRASL